MGVRRDEIIFPGDFMQIKHDGDGKIYNDNTLLFEVKISEGDEVAKRINLLLEESKSRSQQMVPCPSCLQFVLFRIVGR